MPIIKNSHLTVFISERHGAIANVFDSNQDALLWSAEPEQHYQPEQGGCFPLTPYSNRVRDQHFTWQGKRYAIADNGLAHSNHGDGWLSTWQAQEHSQAHIVLVHEGRFAPFHYRATQTISLHHNAVTINLKLEHLGSTPLPYGIGLHPWFIQDKDTCLYAPANKVWLEDEQHLPTDLIEIPPYWQFNQHRSPLPASFINNAFEGWHANAENTRIAILNYPTRKLRIGIEARNALNRYIVYSSNEGFVCFEPVSHCVDAHNKEDLAGLRVLQTHDTLRGSMRLQFDRL